MWLCLGVSCELQLESHYCNHLKAGLDAGLKLEDLLLRQLTYREAGFSSYYVGLFSIGLHEHPHDMAGDIP